MASTRYGRIQHDRYSAINVKFPSPDARQEFADKFNEYHASHDHDSEVPTFEMITAADTKGYDGGRTPVELEYISIDGYTHKELIEYHEENGLYTSVFYRPPTCCVAPIISLDREFLVADTLERHELSAIFGDMPTDDYQSLLSSVEKDGFMDQHIKILDGKVLDGWHRYRAGRELNLLRKLKFQQWDEKNDGDPQTFVYARNIERRHLDKATRAQIAVHFNERFGHGGDRKNDDGSKCQNGTLKSREELAKEVGVSVRTIARAVEVEKEGESEAVISGEKTAGEVIKARDAARLKKHKQQILKNMWDTRIQAARDYTGDSDTDLNQYLSLDDLEKGFVKHNESFAEAFTSGMQRIDRAHGNLQDFQDRAFEVDEHGVAKVSIDDLDKESKAIGFYAGDIRQWQRPDWSPDTNWILPLIEAKKVARGHIAPRPEPKPEPDLKELREQVKAEMPKWKQRYKESGKEESELVSRASFSALIHVLRNWETASSTPPEEGAATAEELEELLKHLKGDSFVFIFRLRAYIRETEQPAPDETLPFVPADEDEDEADLEEALNSLMDVAAELDSLFLEDFEPEDYDKLCELASVAHECDRSILYRIIYEEDLPEHFRTPELRQWGTILKRILEDVESEADWVAKLRSDDEVSSPDAQIVTETDAIDVAIETWKTEKYAYLPHLSAATKPMFIDAAKRWHGLSRDADIEEKKVLGLLSSDAQTFRRWVEQQVSGVDIFQPEPEPEADEDTSLTEIDNLPAVKNFLENIDSQVETYIDPIQRDNLSCAIYDIFLSDGDVYVTERQQLAILIDVAHSILVESESTSF